MKYTGSCHCGKVRYEVEMDLKKVISCNCSICHKKGSLLTFVPVAQFKLLQGSEVLSDYQFSKRSVHHLFCSVCGVSSFGKGNAPDGTEMRAINVRCLDGVELDQLEVQHFDGRSL